MMKKLTVVWLGGLVAVLVLSATVFAENVKMTIMGQDVSYASGEPFVEQGTTMLPLRDLLNALGVGNGNIRWDGSTRTVTAISGSYTITLTVGQKQLYRNGELFGESIIPAAERGGHVYLPVRVVAEALDYKVGYNGATGEVTIDQGTEKAGDPTVPQTKQDTGAAEQQPTSEQQPTDDQDTGGDTEASASENAGFKSNSGGSVILPDVTPAEGQLYGFVSAVSSADSTVTLVLKDGTKKHIKVGKAAKVTYTGGYEESGSDYVAQGHGGLAALATLNADGSAGALSIYEIKAKATLISITQTTQKVPTGTGEMVEVPLTSIQIKLDNGSAVTLNGGMPLDTHAFKAGDQVIVEGAIEDQKGFSSITKS